MEVIVKKFVLVAMLLILPSLALAENYGGVPERFFGFIRQGKTDEAIDYFASTNHWTGKNSDQMIQLKGELAKLTPLVGNYLFCELISESRVGTRYVHQIYIVGYDRQPVRFELKMYKPTTEWRLQGISFDISLTDDIEKQANQRIVK
jgi:hypothetical protein